MDFKDNKYILLIYYYIISYYNYYKRLHLLSIVVKIVVRNLLYVRLTYYFPGFLVSNNFKQSRSKEQKFLVRLHICL
jgi:hypothetical protein